MHVIIGNSAAAIGAVEGIRSVDKKSPICLISDEPYHTYSRPLISYYLAGKVSEEQMLYRPRGFYQDNRVGLFLGQRAVSLDTEDRKVVLEEGMAVAYDRLLIATGGRPFLPPVEGLDKGNVFTFSKWDDVKRIKTAFFRRAEVVVVGGGLIGLKAAESLAMLGARVTVVELADRILSTILDADAAGIVQKKLEERGIEFRLGTTTTTILGDKKVSGVVLKDGSRLFCELLVFAIGVVPNKGIVEGTPVETNHGILVDANLRTSVKEIYAAGDVSEGYDVLNGEKRVLPILPNAYKQGETAGLNMANKTTRFEGGFAFNSIGFFDFPMVTAGLQGADDGGSIEALASLSPETDVYRKVFVKEGRLVGFILLGGIDRAGVLTGLIRDRIDVGDFKQDLLQEDFGYVSLPAELRRERLWG